MTLEVGTYVITDTVACYGCESFKVRTHLGTLTIYIHTYIHI